MIDAGEEFLNVALQDVTLSATSTYERLEPPNRCMDTAARQAGVGVVDEPTPQGWVDYIEQCMVNDTITKRGSAHFSALRVGDPKAAIGAPIVCLRFEFTAYLPEFRLEVVFKAPHLSPIAFATAGTEEGEAQIVERNKVREQVLFTTHGVATGPAFEASYQPDRWLFLLTRARGGQRQG